MLAGAASAYGTNLLNYHRENDIDPESIASLKLAHPYLSPALSKGDMRLQIDLD
jgi:hypothetical protein